MVDRLAIGVPELDRMIGGGVVKGSLTTLIGPPGAGKSILSRRFIYTGIEEGRSAFLVSTGESEETVLDTMKQFKWSKGLKEKLHVLDCYSGRFGGAKPEYSASLQSPTDVSVTLSRMLDEQNAKATDASRIVIDTFTDFIKSAGIERALKLLDSIRTKLRSRWVTGLLLLEEGVHDERAVSSIEYTTDGTIRMKIADQGRFMMVSRMAATPLTPKWIPYAIGGPS